jgi:FkbM family methyltransferase
MKLIIDIGSNVLEGFRKLNSLGDISDDDRKIFVEANPECWEYLDNEVPKIKNSRLIKKALDVKNGTVELITRADKKSDVAATILGESFLVDSLNSWNIQVEHYNRYTVDTITLMDILEEEKGEYESIILKLDAEGVEYEVIRQIIDEKIPINKIFCEFHVHNKEQNDQMNDIIKSLDDVKIDYYPWD